MSQFISYVKNLFHSTSNQDRKRRRHDVIPEGASHFPKYRRVSNVFPKQYTQRSDEIDAFQLVKQNRLYYNEILENYAMEQQQHQRKHFQAINDEEFSDEEEATTIRAPTLSNNNHRFIRQPQSSSFSSSYNFSSTRQPAPSSSSVAPSTFKFSQNQFQRSDDDVEFMGASNMFNSKPRRGIPELLPISKTVQPQLNGSSQNGNDKSRPRRSIFDFYNKNRAFSNDSSKIKLPQSIIDRNHNMEVKQKYDNLLKKLIPRYPFKAHQKFEHVARPKHNDLHIPTVDLSSDENEPTSAISGSRIPTQSNNYPSLFRFNHIESKRAPVFVDLSDDDDSDPSFIRDRVLTSTILKPRNESSNSNTHERRSSSIIVPDVTPVNSLKDRQQSKACLQDDAITSIVRRFKESQKQKDSQIDDVKKSLVSLQIDTAQHERAQQKRIDQTVSSLQQCIIFDEEDEVVDEFPPLTQQQLDVIRYALSGGHRGEALVNKFNMSITRHDLNTLDGMNWLNDEVINFYMELIRHRSEEVDHLPKVHAMNTFFLVNLLTKGYSSVRRWTRKVDIFSCDIIPIPVHVGGVHWCMSVIHMREKSIKYYDSMGHPNNSVLDALTQYLKEESLDKKKVPFDTSDWTIECVRDCPQQRNGSDCGVFSCMFAEFISRDSNITFDQQHMQYFRRKMVFEITAGKLILGY